MATRANILQANPNEPGAMSIRRAINIRRAAGLHAMPPGLRAKGPPRASSCQVKRGPGVHLTRDLTVAPRLQRESQLERRENGRARQNPRGGPRTAATGPENAPGRCCAPSPHGGLRTRWVSFVNMVVFTHNQASLISAGYHRQIGWCTRRWRMQPQLEAFIEAAGTRRRGLKSCAKCARVTSDVCFRDSSSSSRALPAS